MTQCKQGKIQAITGFSKFKTTSAFGTALRAINQGWNILVVQFVKGVESGEVELLKKTFPDYVTILRYGVNKIVLPNNVEKFDKDETQRGWKEMICRLGMEGCESTPYDLLILDEVFVALEMKLLTHGQYFDFLKDKPKELEVISTGRVNSKDLMHKITMASDLHTDAYMKKHYFNPKCPNCKRSWEWHHRFCSYCGAKLESGVIARKGIEI